MNSTYIFFGRSGAGKGTQAQLLKEQLEKQGRTVKYIETGAAFRTFIESDSFAAKKAKEQMAKGELLPEFLPIWMWADFLIKNVSGDEDLILDGLARRPHEAPILDSALRFFGRTNVHIIYVNVSIDWATERLMARGRADDHIDEIKKRLTWFDWNVVPSMAYFHELPQYKFHDINGEQTIEAVHTEITKSIENRI